MSTLDRLFLDTAAASASAEVTVLLDITITRAWLLRLVTHAAAFVPKRDAMPVLKNVQLIAEAGKLTVVATDMQVTLVASTTDVEVHTEGLAVLSAEKLLTVLRSAESNYTHVTITTKGCNIRIGTARWSMRVPSGADYPLLPVPGDGAGVSTTAQEFGDSVESVLYAAGKATDRPGLDAVDISGGLVTACDGSRFAQAPLRPVIPSPVTLPVAAIGRIIRRLEPGPVDIIVLDRYIVIRNGPNTYLITKLTDPYPDLSATLLRPALANRHTVTMDARVLNDALGRVRIAADPDTHGVALVLADKRCTVATQDPHGNTAVDTLECDWAGPIRLLTVHGGHLDDLVRARIESAWAGECTVTLHLGEDTKTRRSPILCRTDDNGAVGVIQQMLLDWADGLR